MKISQQHIDKIRDRINTLNECLNQIDSKHPSETTCGMGATITSLSHILDEIDLEIVNKKVVSTYLTYDEFMKKVMDSDDNNITDMWYSFRLKNRPNAESTDHFYNRHIEYINQTIVPNL